MSVLRIVRPVGLGSWGILGALLVSLLVTGGGIAPSHLGSGLAVASSGGCAGTSIPAAYTGAVTVDGGPLNASAAGGVHLGYNFSTDGQTVDRSTGAILSLTCVSLGGTTTSSANGSFSLDLTLPSTHCTPSACITNTGWYGPLEVAPTSPLPSGYDALSMVNGSSLHVALVAELGGLALTPAGTTDILSTEAPGAFAARVTNAVGGPSPLTPTLAWNLTGTGWSFAGSGAGANVTVEALPGAGAGALSVTASARVGTNRFVVGPVLVELAAVSTAFTGGGANRTDLDAGGAVAFTADGTGAPGYTYTALVAPGLGLAPVDWPCAATPSGGDTVALACNGTVAYPSAGSADPSVQLTNTYSVGDGTLPSVTVAPLPAISLAPEAPAGYAGTPVPVRVSVIPGSGTAPYTRACLAPGLGVPLCSSAPGPNWTFTPVYPTPGNYTAVAWAIDRAGTNTSVEVTVKVVAPLSLAPVELPVGILADSPASLSGRVAGGDLPLRYWWNVSGTSTPVARGTLVVDGPFTVTWVPPDPGTFVLSLDVVDALGTVMNASVTARVGPAGASGLAGVVVPGAVPVVAGAPVALVWQAEDLQGAAVPGFSAAGEVQVVATDPSGSGVVWVNASGAGALATGADGMFVLPSSAWDLGRLALLVSAARAGTYTVQLEGTDLLDETNAAALTVVADLTDLHLFHPAVALAGARANRTFWRIADAFGNPALGASVDVLFQDGGTSNVSIVPVEPAGNGTTGVWVNFSARSAAAGTLEVTETDLAHTVLLGPIAIPAAASAGPLLSPPVATLATVAPVGVLGVGLTAWAQRRKRAAAARDDGPDEADLRRLVEGRDRVIALVREARAVDLAGLETAWGDGPAPPELPDWLASLVADGTLGARTGPDGVARFCLVASADGPPLVLLDPDALARVTAARRALMDEPDAGADTDTVD
jgi:hypothetical protein